MAEIIERCGLWPVFDHLLLQFFRFLPLHGDRRAGHRLFPVPVDDPREERAGRWLGQSSVGHDHGVH